MRRLIYFVEVTSGDAELLTEETYISRHCSLARMFKTKILVYFSSF